MKFYVIHNSDGDTTVDELTEDELLERLDFEDPYYGVNNFFKEIPKNTDTNYWGEGILIIKGKIVIPKSKEVTIRYEL